MKRQVWFLLVLLLGTGSLVNASRVDDPTMRPVQNLELHQMIAGEWQPSFEEGEPLVLTPFEFVLGGAPDTCGLAGSVTWVNNLAGTSTIVNDAVEEPTDPILACMYGNPVSNTGYRTVWYQFTAPDNGWVKVQTHPNSDYRENYDTVIAIYENLRGDVDCTTLASAVAACDDDSNGFLSIAYASVVKGKQYWVEVADWHLAANFTKRLNITGTFIGLESLWEQVGTMPLPRSRHAAVVVGDEIYVIAGQTVVAGNPVRTNSVQRYNVNTGTWQNLTSMLAGSDGNGYSNTDAAYLGGKIYLPSGYVGDDDNYDGTHWVYDIATNSWDTTTSITSEGVEPYGWIQAVSVPNVGGYYVVGGVTGPILDPLATPHDELFLFQPSDIGDPWEQIPHSMNTARYAHTAAMVPVKIGSTWVDQICVAGGLSEVRFSDGSETPVILSSAECYRVGSSSWVSIGSMAFFRYNAGSAVGPDGKWYVFGGTDENGSSVSAVEVYDPVTNSWEVLPGNYDLTDPPRSWVRGGFVGYDLWVTGGHHNTPVGDLVVNLVERAFFPSVVPNEYPIYLPAFYTSPPLERWNDTFATANSLQFNQIHYDRFHDRDDFFDFFYFDLDRTSSVIVHLQSIEIEQGYNVEVYSANKVRVGVGENPGSLDEQVPLNNLPAGRYYVMVIKSYPGEPTDDYYRLWVQR